MHGLDESLEPGRIGDRGDVGYDQPLDPVRRRERQHHRHLATLLGGEFLGAFIGACLVWASYSNHWADTEDPGLKLAVFCTAPAIRNTVANIVTEVVGTFLLVFGVLAILATPSTVDTGLVPLLVGLLVLAIGLSLGGPTGYAINPARDLAPRIAHFLLPIPGKGPSDWGYAWIPVAAPLAGGALGALCFEWWFPG